MFKPSVFLLLLMLGVVWAKPTSKEAFYSLEKDNIWELDSKSFGLWEDMVNREHASVIQFFMSTSAMSKEVTPIYSKTAKRTSGWTKFIKFHAVDCSLDENDAICEKYGFRAAPMIKYFPAHSDSTNLGTKIDMYLNETVLLKHIIRKLNADYSNGVCPNCPNLKPFPETTATLHDAWKFMMDECYYRQIMLVPTESIDDPKGIDRLVNVTNAIRRQILKPSSSSLPIWDVPVYRILKDHPLIRNPYVEIKDYELIMLQRISDYDNFYNYPMYKYDHDDPLISQIPFKSVADKIIQPTCSDEYYTIRALEFPDILQEMGEWSVTKKHGRDFYVHVLGSLRVYHYF